MPSGHPEIERGLITLYDPFEQGPLPVGVRTAQAFDAARNRSFPCEIWYPESAPDTYPLIVFSHSSGGGRRQSTFLCSHLSSHGYVVAAMDHSEAIAPELARKVGETAEERTARIQGWIANRVPDIKLLLDALLDGKLWDGEAKLDASRIGIAGHSFGGWTALAAPDRDSRIKAVVAMAPGGSSLRKPGMLPLELRFEWGRDVPALFLVAEGDSSLPLDGMQELFVRMPATKKMFVLPRTDHMHFMDNVEQLHEAVRGMVFPEELAWLPKAMLPVKELCSGEQAHRFIKGMTLCHFDAYLKGQAAALRFLTTSADPDHAVI